MTRLSQSFLVVLALSMLLAFCVLAQERSEPGTLEQKHLGPIHDAVTHLIRHVETLQEDVLEHLDGRKEQILYRQGDAVLVQLVQFEASLRSGLGRKKLYEDFDQVEPRIQELLKGVRILGPSERALQRQATRLGVALEDLYFTISLGDTTPDRIKQVVERQTGTLVIAAQELKRTANYALGTTPGHAVALDAIGKLTEAAEACRKNLAGGAKADDQRRDFVALTNAWKHVIHHLEDLKTQENLFLLRSAGRIDLLHERLHQLLGLEGKCPHLSIRS